LAHFLRTAVGRKLVEKKTVLELGAGTGLISLMCAKFLKAKRTMATDGLGDVVQSMEENFVANGLNVPGDIECEVLKWGWMLKGSMFDEVDERNCVNTVLGGDIVRGESFRLRYLMAHRKLQTYDVSVIPSLVATLRDLFDRYPSLRVLISATIRNQETFEVFLAACGEALGPGQML
jgi:predicted nicotinamide N-methyase